MVSPDATGKGVPHHASGTPLTDKCKGRDQYIVMMEVLDTSAESFPFASSASNPSPQPDPAMEAAKEIDREEDPELWDAAEQSPEDFPLQWQEWSRAASIIRAAYAKREERIRELENDLKLEFQRSEYLRGLSEQVRQETIQRAESAEARVKVLEGTVAQRDAEIASLHTGATGWIEECVSSQVRARIEAALIDGLSKEALKEKP